MKLTIPKYKLKSGIKNICLFIRSKKFLTILICTVFSALIVLFFSSAITPIKYKLSVGMVPTQTITATKDVVDEIATEKNRQNAENSVTPTYVYNDGVADEVLQNIETLRNEISVTLQYAKTLPDYSKNKQFSDEEVAYASKLINHIKFKDHQLRTILSSNENDLLSLLSNLYDAVQNTMVSNVSQGQENAAINSVLQIIGYKTDINLLQNIATPILRHVIRPNMVINAEATDKAKKEARQAVEPVVFKQGQNIVVKGEGRISQNQIKMLEELGLLSSTQSDYNTYYGATIVICISLLVLHFSLYFFSKDVYDDHRKLIFIYISILISLLLAYAAKSADLIYLAPLTLCAMSLASTLGPKPAIITNSTLSIILPFLLVIGSHTPNTNILFLFASAFLSGTIATFLLKNNIKRINVLIVGLLVSCISFLSVVGVGLMISNDIGYVLTNSLWSMSGIFISALLTLAFQPVVEVLFNISSPARLLDLSNPMHPLLKRLQLEAPGTYHHSIIIANLSEAAAHEIGANELIARVGGYFHDIGKLKRPLYFKENQIGKNNPHDKTPPEISASIIASHTRDGLALAKQYRLPSEIQNIILNHHGNSIIKYFYNKALEQAEGEEFIDPEKYRYDGSPPSNKETSIVMICDTLEAAVRTLSNPSKEEMEAFIKKLIDGKINDGQLSASPLSFAELEKIAKSCANVLYGVFHERIEYPDQIKQNKLKLPIVPSLFDDSLQETDLNYTLDKNEKK